MSENRATQAPGPAWSGVEGPGQPNQERAIGPNKRRKGQDDNKGQLMWGVKTTLVPGVLSPSWD